MSGHGQRCACGYSMKHTKARKLGRRRWRLCLKCGLTSGVRMVGPKGTGRVKA